MGDLRSALLSELKMVLSAKGGSGIDAEEDIKPSSLPKHRFTLAQKHGAVPPVPPVSSPPWQLSPPSLQQQVIPQNSVSDEMIKKLFSNRICSHRDLINKGVRREALRKKYNCILEIDIVPLSGIFHQIRNFFYNKPFEIGDRFCYGGIYLDYLPKRAHQIKRLYIVNFRGTSDLELIDKVIKIGESYELNLKIDKMGFNPFD